MKLGIYPSAVVLRNNRTDSNYPNTRNAKFNVQNAKSDTFEKSYDVKSEMPSFLGTIKSKDLYKDCQNIKGSIKSLVERFDIDEFFVIGKNQDKNSPEKIFVNLKNKMLIETMDNNISKIGFLKEKENDFRLTEYNVDDKGNLWENNNGIYNGKYQKDISKNVIDSGSKNPGYLVCDLDGCLINSDWIRNLIHDTNLSKRAGYDLFNDLVNTATSYIDKFCLNFIYHKLAEGLKLHFLTAREEKIGDATIDFIQKRTNLTCGKDFSINFRPTGDMTKAVDYKQDYIHKMMKKDKQISLAIDDKPEITNMYVNNGIKTITWHNKPNDL